ncbi:MAG: SPFH domain-containing protein [Planctomycetota bacterium]|jgi:membrane protease subunit HflC
MKRSLPSMIAGALLVLILLLYMITFQVRFTEVAVVRTFGRADESDVITEPGLCWKLPWPIQKVDKYDNWVNVAITTGEETPTRDGKNLVVTTAIGWRIDNPYVFSIRCADLKDGEEKLKSRVRNDQKTVISQYDFANFISTKTDELKYDEIEAKILDAVAASAKDLYGIQVESVGISKLALPSRITQTVFEAMKKERQAVAARYTSEGESKAKTRTDKAEGIAGTILAFADRKAAEIVAKGKEQAAKYNEIFRQDEELAKYLLKIENLKIMLKDRSTIVLDADQEPMYLLKGSELSAPAETPASKTDQESASAESGKKVPNVIKMK